MMPVILEFYDARAVSVEHCTRGKQLAHAPCGLKKSCAPVCLPNRIGPTFRPALNPPDRDKKFGQTSDCVVHGRSSQLRTTSVACHSTSAVVTPWVTGCVERIPRQRRRVLRRFLSRRRIFARSSQAVVLTQGSAPCPLPHVSLQAMVKVEFTYHPGSLHPTEAARAHHMRYEEGMSWEAMAAEVVNLQGEKPSLKAP